MKGRRKGEEGRREEMKGSLTVCTCSFSWKKSLPSSLSPTIHYKHKEHITKKEIHTLFQEVDEFI